MFTLPSLGYDYDAFGPYISKNIMELHHDKHHQTYVDKLNVALEQAPELADKSITELLTNLDAVPESIRTAVRNHGGGHYNHSQFWKWMSPLTAAKSPYQWPAKWSTRRRADGQIWRLPEVRR